MNLDSVLDKAWDFLAKSMESKKEQNQAEGQRLSDVESEKEKTKRMQLSSQEKIQGLINAGMIDKQELVNQGLFSEQQLANSGILSKQELENKGGYQRQELANSGDLAVQNQSDQGELARSQLSSETDRYVEDSKANTTRDTTTATMSMYNPDGTQASDRIIRPGRDVNTRTETIDPKQSDLLNSNGSAKVDPSTGEDTGYPKNLDPEVMSKQVADMDKAPGVSNPAPVSLSPDAGAGRHSTERRTQGFNGRSEMPTTPAPAVAPVPGVGSRSMPTNPGTMNGPYMMHPEQFQPVPGPTEWPGMIFDRMLPNGTAIPEGYGNDVRNNIAKGFPPRKKIPQMPEETLYPINNRQRMF